MTSEELNRLEQEIRLEKSKGHSSNVSMKIAQVERLIEAARSKLQTAEILPFDVAAEVRKDNIQQWRYTQRWASHARQQRLERMEKERIKKRNQRKQELIDKWKNYSGSQKNNATN